MSEETLGSSPNTEAHNWDNNGQEVDHPQWTGQTDKVSGESLDVVNSFEPNHGQIGSSESEAITLETGDDTANNDETIEQEPDKSNEQKIELNGEDIRHRIDSGEDVKDLIESGVDVNEIMRQLTKEELDKNEYVLLLSGKPLDANFLAAGLSDWSVSYNCDLLVAAGADVQKLMPRIDTHARLIHIEKLREMGADIDANALSDEFDLEDIPFYFYELVRAGADPYHLYSRMRPIDIPGNIGSLRKLGIEVNADELISRLTPFEIAKTINYLREAGVEVDLEEILPKLNSEEIDYSRQYLIAAGISGERLDALQSIRKDEEYIVQERAARIEHARRVMNDPYAVGELYLKRSLLPKYNGLTIVDVMKAEFGLDEGDLSLPSLVLSPERND